MDGGKPIVPRSDTAFVLIYQPVQELLDVFPGEFVQSELLNFYREYIPIIADKLNEGLTIGFYRIWTEIPLMRKIVCKEPAEMPCKISICFH